MVQILKWSVSKMISSVLVVFVLLPIIGLGLKNGERCNNQWGEKATCTNIYSCKAAIDAIATIENGKTMYAMGPVCGYDYEPLVCCITIADFEKVFRNNPNIDLTITNNPPVFNKPVQVMKKVTNTKPSIPPQITKTLPVFNKPAQVMMKVSNTNPSIPPQMSITSDFSSFESSGKVDVFNTSDSNKPVNEPYRTLIKSEGNQLSIDKSKDMDSSAVAGGGNDLFTTPVTTSTSAPLRITQAPEESKEAHKSEEFHAEFNEEFEDCGCGDEVEEEY